MTDVELLRDLAKSEDSVIAPNISMEGERIRSIAARYERRERELERLEAVVCEEDYNSIVEVLKHDGR